RVAGRWGGAGRARLRNKRIASRQRTRQRQIKAPTPIEMTEPKHSMQRAPSAWITRYAHLVPPGARVLDVAAGGGRHALFFAARGNRVVAVDRDEGAIAAYADPPRIETRTVDL